MQDSVLDPVFPLRLVRGQGVVICAVHLRRAAIPEVRQDIVVALNTSQRLRLITDSFL